MIDTESRISQCIRNQQYDRIKLYVNLGFEFNLSEANGDNLEKFGNSGNEIFDYVVENNFNAIKRVSFKRLNQINDNGYTPLMWAIISHRNTIAKYLIDQKIGIEMKTATQDNCFTIAARFKNFEILEYLLEHYSFSKLGMFNCNKRGFNALHFACALKSIRLVKVLMPLMTMEDVLSRNMYGANCLHWIAHGNSVPDHEKLGVFKNFHALLSKKRNSKPALTELLSHKNTIDFTPFSWLELYKNNQSCNFLIKG